MTLTRSMCAKLASQPAAEEMFQTPQKKMEMKFTASPRSLPTPPTAQRFICHLCRNVGTQDSDFSSNVSLSKFNDFTEHVNIKFSELELQCENLSDQISTIVQSIISHKKIINELELEIADLIISHSSSPARVTESYSSAPPSKSVPSSDCVPASSSAPPSLSASPFPSDPLPRSAPPSHSVPASRSAPPSRNTRPTHSATYWRSATPLPTSTLPRHLAPLSPSSHPSRSYPRTTSRSIPPAPSSSYHSSQYSNREGHIAVAKHYPLKIRERFSGNKNSILILGDSNTKHIKLSNAYDLVRVPTFLIQEIDPTRCKGYGRVWIHCGINNLRYNRCTSYSDVKHIFKIFMNKLSAIRNMCPETKIYVSPILPCAIPGLNNRTAWFNSLLFSVRNIWWHELKFDQFCCWQTGMLASQFRSFRNRGDKIHLGRHGINALEHALLCALNKVDGRLYSAVVINH